MIPRFAGRSCGTCIGSPADAVAEERARVANEGWGKALLDLQWDDGSWDGGAWGPGDFSEAGVQGHAARRGPRPCGCLRCSPILASIPRIQRVVAAIDTRRRQRALGVRERAVLRRRGRGVHQRTHRARRRVLRARHDSPGRAAAWASNSTTAAGTARRSTGPRSRASTRRLGCSRGLSSTRHSATAPTRESRPRSIARSSTCTRAACSGDCATARCAQEYYLFFPFPQRHHYNVLRMLDLMRYRGRDAGSALRRGHRDHPRAPRRRTADGSTRARQRGATTSRSRPSASRGAGSRSSARGCSTGGTRRLRRSRRSR